MAIPQRLLTPCRQSRGSLHDIFDLASIDPSLTQLSEFFCRQTTTLVFVTARFAQERNPNLAPRVRIEVVVPQGDVDARLEGFVKDANAVGGEEEDAAEIPVKNSRRVRNVVDAVRIT
jgi:hypothetical protein